MIESSEETTQTAWNQDLLGFREIGDAFTNLVRSIEGSKVLSIEAGFGHGKTFFRSAWAEHLRELGEVVVEIDALKSDHSGDPVVTFLGALIELLPQQENSRWLKALSTGKRMMWGTAKIGAAAVARKAGEELVSKIEENLASDGKTSAVDDLIKEVGQGVSKALSAQLAAQLSAERIRIQEMPAQMQALREELTGSDEGRVIILIDELDRCHPDYAIALLEAMKLVFDQPGFVFCLFVNPVYLENMASKRFGTFAEGERYLDKFVDLRLKLESTPESKGAAVKTLVEQLPDYLPFGDDAEFSKARAAEVAAELAVTLKATMRQSKRLIERVELVLRCYSDLPIDCPLLVYLAFEGQMVRSTGDRSEVLPRARLVPEVAEKFKSSSASETDVYRAQNTAEIWVNDNCVELVGLSDERYRSPPARRGFSFFDWARVVHHLSQHYIPEHQAMLDAVHRYQVDELKDASAD
ncbi:MAG: P-loop NTPase fold protein [Paracoccaceae bacterium]|nr:P-loop NTPase fold protein [Paracoccaceae bacterium]